MAHEYPVLLDLAKETHNGEFIKIAETLDKKNPLFRHAAWEEANDLTGHVHDRRSNVVTGTLRAANEGVESSDAKAYQVTEGIMSIEAHSVVDEFLADKSPNWKKFLMNRERPFIEGLTQQAVDYFLYGSVAADLKAIDGLVARTPLLAGANVYGNGDASAGAVTSVYLIQWGEGKVRLLYPRGSKTMGVRRLYKGKEYIQEVYSAGATTGKRHYAHVTQFFLNFGLMIEDDRAMQRVCNIGTGLANHVSVDLIIEALNNMMDEGEGAVIYCNAKVKTQFDIAAKNQGNAFHVTEDPWGKKVTHFWETPIYKMEGIKNTETVVA